MILRITSPKRLGGPVSNWEQFFPYYAGYPLHFASNIIDSADLLPGSRVLDPWNGSGTTTYAASVRGHTAIGIDVNPVMAVVARGRMLSPTEADSIVPLCTEIIRGVKSRKPAVNEPLYDWFDRD
ncbi:MAG: site-specific DNA-methyltransferase, partial [Alphaproteobacteria bacterium]|nr:site-specific DNA-methyltransferase [Alphaproteobacteria bacterium]